MSPESDAGLAHRIANELSACRKRGIERLDVRSHNQKPVPASELTRLASQHTLARKLALPGRGAQIKWLIRDAVDALADENEPDARLLRDLFFGDDQDYAGLRSAGELLDSTRKKYSETSEVRFRVRQNAAFRALALLLLTFVPDPSQSNPIDEQPTENDPLEDAFEPELERYEITAGYVGDGGRFVRLLAEAANITIVGMTNENLATMLESALDKKRKMLRRPSVFWQSLRIVFLRDELLSYVNYERPEYPDQEEAQKQRAQGAAYGRRSVNVFLRRIEVARWSVYISPHMPALTGTLFEMPNGGRIVQLLVRHPQRSSSDHMYLELVDATGYFSAVFEDVVRTSVNYNDVVPVGVPRAEKFYCTGSRFQQNILKDGSGATGWVPVVLALTWRTRNGNAEPLLQLRTGENAARELNRFSHLSGHIVREDYSDLAGVQAMDGVGTQPLPPPLELDLRHEAPERAARRRVQMETGQSSLAEFEPLGTFRYLHPDKEHLFFFVYACRFHDGFQPPRHAEMHYVPFPEHLALRENQVLLKAEQLCQAPAMPPKIRSAAWEIVGQNLILHGHSELADRVMRTSRQPSAREISEIRQLVARTTQTSFFGGRELQLMGLSGLQYREFFTLLLPLYARIGVQGAASHLAHIQDDETLRNAVARLAWLYQDEELMTAIPIEI